MMPKDKDRLGEKLARMRADHERWREEILLLRKEIQNASRALNQREALLHSLPAGLIVLEKAKIVEANEFILSRLGYSIEDVVSQPFTDLVHPRLKNVARDFLRRRASGKWVPEEYETDLVAKNGQTLSFDVKLRKVRKGGRTAFLLMLTPSEDRMIREKELVESEKRESLCRMARELTRRYFPRTEKRAAWVWSSEKGKAPAFPAMRSAVENGNEGIVKITRALESYTKEALEPSQKGPIDLRGVVKQVAAYVASRVNVPPQVQGPEINIKTYLRAVSPVEGDSGEIEEMLSQVISNAVEAMPHGGDLYLSIEENAGQAHIYVQDSGLGIGPEIIDKVFDPFFTTKEDGRPGLGLCVARSIARRHKGTLELSSKKNEGTVVSIRLPLATEAPGKGRKRKKANEVCILLVEQDGMIRDLLYKMLEHKGYRVINVATGPEALQQIEKKVFDLAIVGSGTLDKRGRDLIGEIRKKKPGLRIAWITGDGTGVRKSKEAGPVVDLLIRKPIDMATTLGKLSQLLTG
ncbi:MAG: ATP-binding protein [Deltaproteobacteria bacterium]